MSVSLLIAGAVALPVNRWLIAGGKGHAVVHWYSELPAVQTRVEELVAEAARRRTARGES